MCSFSTRLKTGLRNYQIGFVKTMLKADIVKLQNALLSAACFFASMCVAVIALLKLHFPEFHLCHCRDVVGRAFRLRCSHTVLYYISQNAQLKPPRWHPGEPRFLLPRSAHSLCGIKVKTPAVSSAYGVE